MGAKVAVGDPITVVLIHFGAPVATAGYVSHPVELRGVAVFTFTLDRDQLGKNWVGTDASRRRLSNENITWIRGHHAQGSPEANALITAWTLTR